MENYIFTIDTGTTNTRISLWNEKNGIFNYIDTSTNPTGVRNTAFNGNNLQLKDAVKNCIDKLSVSYNINEKGNIIILASGMITSNIGLIEIPPITAPADISALANATKQVLLDDVSHIPIWFIPGIKNFEEPVTLNNFEKMDVMRGEEVESIAAIKKYFNGNPMLLVLPGSHTKFVSINRQKQITGCLTSITGELLSAITCNTIISDSVGKEFINSEKDYNKKFVLLGYQAAKKYGTGRAAFLSRILSQYANYDCKTLANYILGAVIENDVKAIESSDAISINQDTNIIITGKYPFGAAIYDLLNSENFFKNITYEKTGSVKSLSTIGALLVAKEKGIL